MNSRTRTRRSSSPGPNVKSIAMESPSSPDRVTRIAGEAKSVQRVVPSGTGRAFRRRRLSAAHVVALLVATLAAGDAFAIDFYEIQIYRTERKSTRLNS